MVPGPWREVSDLADNDEFHATAYLSSRNPAGSATDAASTSGVSFSTSTEVVRIMARCGLPPDSVLLLGHLLQPAQHAAETFLRGLAGAGAAAVVFAAPGGTASILIVGQDRGAVDLAAFGVHLVDAPA